MGHPKQIFTVILLTSLLFSWGVKAQDRISNTNNFGAYTGPDQNVIINNDFTNSNTSDPNEIDPTGKNNFTGGDSNKIRNITSGDPTRANISYGKNNFVRDSRYSLAVGKDNFIREADSGIALGENNKIDGGLLNVDNLISIGRNTQNFESESIILGFGANNNRLTQVGERSITLGTYNESTDEPFNTLNIRPPSSIGAFTAPVVGIGTINPNAKLNIVNRGATEDNNNPSVALRVERFRNLQSNIELFNVRDDGAAGFNIPANPSRDRAPYQFEESQSSPFQNGQGRANIVQNYSNFPDFEDCCPPNQVNNDKAKWLALGERPPGQNDAQVAYGLAEVWDNNAGNFVLLDQTPGDEQETAAKDLAITFQDVTTANGDFAGRDGRNRLRFLFRNGQPIEDPAGRFELMSLEPTGEVAVGDYSDNALDPQANRLEVKTDRDCEPGTDCNENGNEETIMEVLKNKNPGNPAGDPVFTVRDNGNVIIGNGTALGGANPGENFQVDGSAYTNGMWRMSDMRFKKDTQIIKEPLDKLSKIDGITYRYAENQYTQGRNFRMNERQSGILAQQVKKVLPEAVREGKGGLYSVNYDGIIPLLIETNKAQQEKMENQGERIEKLEAKAQKVEKLQQQVKELQARINGLIQDYAKPGNSFKNDGEKNLNKRTVAIGNEDGQQQAMLLQNRPNPYSNETIIPYFLPRNFESASLLITNINGQFLKRISLQQSGKGKLTLKTQDLNAGQYVYSLIVDGREIQSRKMVVKK